MGKYRRKVGDQDDIHFKEPPWITQNIKTLIKERKYNNRKKRNAKNTEEYNLYNRLYMESKRRVQRTIKEEMTIHEKKLTQTIKENRNTKLWEYINKLTGKESKKQEDLLYNENKEKLGRLETEEDMKHTNTGRKYTTNMRTILDLPGTKIYGKHIVQTQT